MKILRKILWILTAAIILAVCLALIADKPIWDFLDLRTHYVIFNTLNNYISLWLGTASLIGAAATIVMMVYDREKNNKIKKSDVIIVSFFIAFTILHSQMWSFLMLQF